jgi:hypothetical protein
MPSAVDRWFPFPRAVDERAARCVAGGVVVGALVAIFVWHWLAVVLAAGFALRVGWGPRFSPLALVVTRVLVPHLPGPERLVPGPPKRFAQTVGLVVSSGSVVALLAGSPTVAVVLLALLLVAAGLESGLGLCLGCVMFAGLMRIGVVPEAVCLECADLSRRRTA